MELLDVLNWRYAAKRMNGQQIPDQKLDNIIEAVRLAPTSLGLQPFQVVVVKDPALLKQIHESACQQPQIIEGSALLVFAARKNITNAEIDNYIHFVAKTREIPVEKLSAYKGMISSVQSLPAESYFQWAARQAYIAFSVGIVAAAAEKVDATPIEGFTPDKMDQILGLDEQGLGSVVVLALGYRDENNDHLAKAKKIRKPEADLFIRM